MSRVSERWFSPRVGREVQVVRWGETGTPVVFFPTAAGDAEECERFLLVRALEPLLEAGRIKLYSVDSVPGMVWLKEDNRVPAASRAQAGFDAFFEHELVPAIRRDCDSDDIEIIAAGSSIGAYNALAAACRHPDLVSHAVCMSGTYELSKFIDGDMDEAWYFASPLHFVPNMEEGHPALDLLRKRHITISHGTGRWEDPAESWAVARVLGDRGIPNHVDEWGDEWDHDWPTWRERVGFAVGGMDKFNAITGGIVKPYKVADQSPVSKSPRSNPVTVVKAFDGIRKVFAETLDARTRNMGAGHFSFNAAAGRCEACEGDGAIQIDMQFSPVT